MMQIKNSATRYGLVAIILHWVMTILIIGMLSLGLYMTDLPIGMQKLKFYGWHKEFGVLVLMLVTLRITWRASNITPMLNIPTWEKIAARITHWLFYGLMFALPITGWTMSSAAGIPVSFFGWFTLPNLAAPNPALMHLLEDVHSFLAFTLIGAIVLHLCAALKHHFYDKDDILKRMLS